MRHSKKLLATLCVFAFAACSGDDNSKNLEDPTEVGYARDWAGVKYERGYKDDGVLRTDTWMNFPVDLTFGPEGRAWVNDWNNHRIRVVEDDQSFRTVIGTDYEGDGDEEQTDEFPRGNPVGAPGDTVALNHPTDIIFLPDDTLVFAAWHNNKVRKMDYRTEIVTVIAGDEYGFGGDGGPAHAAIFDMPKAVVADSEGQIYVLDQVNQRIRRIDASAPRMIESIAGTGEPGFSGDGALALDASFQWDDGATPVPSGALEMDGDKLYVADTENHRIRLIDLSTGMIETIAGNGESAYAGDGGDALEASFSFPTDIELGPDGRLYVADSGNNVIRAIDLESGIVNQVAGNAKKCSEVVYCYEEDEDAFELPATEMQFLLPWGIAFDPAGDLYVADTNNQRIVKVKMQ